MAGNISIPIQPLLFDNQLHRQVDIVIQRWSMNGLLLEQFLAVPILSMKKMAFTDDLHRQSLSPDELSHNQNMLYRIIGLIVNVNTLYDQWRRLGMTIYRGWLLTVDRWAILRSHLERWLPGRQVLDQERSDMSFHENMLAGYKVFDQSQSCVRWRLPLNVKSVSGLSILILLVVSMSWRVGRTKCTTMTFQTAGLLKSLSLSGHMPESNPYLFIPMAWGEEWGMCTDKDE
jgi:hypothetical protein